MMMKHCRPVSRMRPGKAAQFQSLIELVTLFSQILGLPSIVLQNYSLFFGVLSAYQNLLAIKDPQE